MGAGAGTASGVGATSGSGRGVGAGVKGIGFSGFDDTCSAVMQAADIDKIKHSVVNTARNFGNLLFILLSPIVRLYQYKSALKTF